MGLGSMAGRVLGRWIDTGRFKLALVGKFMLEVRRG